MTLFNMSLLTSIVTNVPHEYKMLTSGGGGTLLSAQFFSKPKTAKKIDIY